MIGEAEGRRGSLARNRVKATRQKALARPDALELKCSLVFAEQMRPPLRALPDEKSPCCRRWLLADADWSRC